MFMGDKAAQDSFKTAVTEDSMIMEEKFQNAVTLPSFHNYLIAVSVEPSYPLTLTDPINPDLPTKPSNRNR